MENDGVVNLTVYNSLGQEVAVLAKGMQSKGKHQVTWDSEGLPEGIYYCRLQTGKENGVVKVIKMK